MITFSKRYRNNRMFRRSYYLRTSYEKERNPNLFIDKELRTRLQSEIKFVIKNEFLENFLIAEDRKENLKYLHKDSLVELGERELGIDLSTVIDPKALSFANGEYSDYYFFDLIEVLIVFTKENKREKLIKRLNYCFKEAGDDYILSQGMIFVKSNTGLKSIIPLIKDSTLKSKLEGLFEIEDHQSRAKIAADVTQYIFSSKEGKSKTKEVSEAILKKISKQFTSAEKCNELFSELNNLVKCAKSLNNQVSDIRHTDQHTIPVDKPDLYKLIAEVNINIAEIIILSMPEEYVISSDLEAQKKDYLERYNIDPNIGWIANADYVDLPF